MNDTELKKSFDSIYSQYNKKEYISTDPLTVLFKYSSSSDIEIVGLIASSLAYGRVSQILKAVHIVLEVMRESPYDYLKRNNKSEISNNFKEFKYRFTKGKDIAGLLIGMKNAITEYNSLENLFVKNYIKGESIINAMDKFVENILNFSQCKANYLIPSPKKGSACKRLCLYLRWMVRKDEVDLGIWNKVSKSDILIPLDTHMFNISKKFDFTKRKSADLKTAVEITERFKNINRDDPVKYDFSLTRFGIMGLGTLSPSSARSFCEANTGNAEPQLGNKFFRSKKK